MEQEDINVSDAVRILAIAPYEGMIGLIEKESEKFPQLKLDIVAGNLEEGVRLAQSNFHADYDIILSRGGTAELLRTRVDIPVAEIPISFYDILRAIQLSANTGGKRAVIGYRSVTCNVQLINDLLGLDLDIYTIVNSEDIAGIVQSLKARGCQAVICDVISSNYVREAGMNAILITSSADSIDLALQSAIQTAHDMNRLRMENHFLRSVLREHSGETVVFNEHSDLYFSSLSDEDDHGILQVLKEMIPEVHEGTARHVWKSVKGYMYSIKSAVIQVERKEYTAYYFTISRSNPGARNAGISFYTRNEAEAALKDSFYHLANEVDTLSEAIDSYNKTNRPILITGEYGTGRTSVAGYIYTHSELKSRPLAEIDCSMLKDRSADFLFNSQRSPFCFSKNTILIKNMEHCSEQMINDMLNALNDMRVCSNNHVIFSGSADGSVFPHYIRYIKDKFQCCEIELSPLREVREQIPAIVNLYLNYLSAQLPNDVIRVDRKAMDLLQAYPWPGNYIQFERILSQAVLDSDDHIVHEEEIQRLFSMEKEVADLPSHSGGTLFNLHQPLAEIQRDIVEKVLAENGGNQSAAAKQLHIGRTTLWRMLREE